MKLIGYAFIISSLISFQLTAEDIVFDIFGVLVHIPLKEKIKNIGVKAPAGYVFREGKSLVRLKSKYLQKLAEITIEEERLARCIYSRETSAQGDPMPDIMIAWQAGEINYKEALDKIAVHLMGAGSYERELFTKISNINFDLATRSQVYKLNKKGVAILKRLASEKDEKGKKRYRFFGLSNMDHEMMNYLKSTYPKVFRNFLDIVYSAQTKSLKPHQHIYQALIDRNQLDPTNCIVIDDQQENVAAAIKLGMRGIVFHRYLDLEKKLRRSHLTTARAF